MKAAFKTPRCANCHFWNVWRQVVLTDDEPKMLGHCVIVVPCDEDAVHTTVQGLTAEDFRCNSHQTDVMRDEAA